ncbi:hypothetical protein V6N13_057389 [Hibiscus sabdariffa]
MLSGRVAPDPDPPVFLVSLAGLGCSNLVDLDLSGFLDSLTGSVCSNLVCLFLGLGKCATFLGPFVLDISTDYFPSLHLGLCFGPCHSIDLSQHWAAAFAISSRAVQY